MTPYTQVYALASCSPLQVSWRFGVGDGPSQQWHRVRVSNALGEQSRRLDQLIGSSIKHCNLGLTK
ncbi:contactin-associated protein-like 4 [Corchorus olitorius]|uniref:Contactin-associated protein-like 4 n=1 Tax=Corchorus olitorius TaxID=93759 RepID=A0A1R3KUD7_9ROSI|nr:contactin-associated protein-like 4 [Corchorus olitorius]